MKNQLFEDLIESIKELPTEILEGMRVNIEKSNKMDVFEAINEKVKDELKGIYQAYSVVRPQNKATQEEQMRKDFEEWYDTYDIRTPQNPFEKEVAWEAFKASRESLVVEIPATIDFSQEHYRDEVKEALQSQGIRYK